MKNERKSLKGRIHQAYIEKFSHDGRGIARIEGKTTFIQGALPTERIDFRYTKIKKDYDEGEVVAISQASEARAKPLCLHYQQCGGCSLQHLKTEAQIQVKQELLLDTLYRIGHCQPETLLPALSDSSWHYRTKARLSIGYLRKKNSTLVGFRKKNDPAYITDIEECLILDERIKIAELRSLLDSLIARATITQIEIAAGEKSVALILRHRSPLSEKDQEKLRCFAREKGFILYLQAENSDNIRFFAKEVETPFLSYRLADENLEFHFQPTDFTQIHPSLNQKMVRQAIELMALEPQDRVLDLFSGLGNFSLPLAKRCEQVIGIEGSENMVTRAKDNAKANGLVNLEFYAKDLDKPGALAELNLRGITKLLLDPPRTGAMTLIKELKTLFLQRILYISCNPATLARDSDILVNQLGYRLQTAGVMNMFPHTAHVESMALFIKDT